MGFFFSGFRFSYFCGLRFPALKVEFLGKNKCSHSAGMWWVLPRVPPWTKVKPHRSQWLRKEFGPVHSSMAARIGQISNAIVWCLSNGLNQPLAKMWTVAKWQNIYTPIYYRMIWNQYKRNSILLMKKECKMHTCTEKMFLIHLLIHIYIIIFN